MGTNNVHERLHHLCDQILDWIDEDEDEIQAIVMLSIRGDGVTLHNCGDDEKATEEMLDWIAMRYEALGARLAVIPLPIRQG